VLGFAGVADGADGYVAAVVPGVGLCGFEGSYGSAGRAAALGCVGHECGLVDSAADGDGDFLRSAAVFGFDRDVGVGSVAAFGYGPAVAYCCGVEGSVGGDDEDVYLFSGIVVGDVFYGGC